MTNVIDIGYHPHEHQRNIHKAMLDKRFCVLVCHRRFGKTLLAVNALVDAASRFTGIDGRFGYCCPLLKQAKKVSWTYLQNSCMRIDGAQKSEGELWIKLPNGSEIALYGADNPEGMRGLYFDGIVLDEPADMKPYVWDEIIRPTLADREGWALFIGTPKGVNTFYELYNKAVASPNWYAGMFRIDETDLPWLPEKEIDLMKETMSEASVRQELYCDFNASSDNTLLSIDEVSASIKRKIVDRFNIDGYPKILACDPARMGNDKTTVYQRQGIWVGEPKEFKKMNNMDVVGHMSRIADQWMPDAIFVDAGRGEGIIDRLRQLGYKVFEINFGGTALNEKRYRNRRVEMWDKMADWVREVGVLPNIPQLKTDLCTPTYNFNNPLNKMQMESKDDIKKRIGKSPDHGDGLALTFAQPVIAKQLNHPEGLLPRRRATHKGNKRKYVVPSQR